jgi:ferredoxin
MGPNASVSTVHLSSSDGLGTDPVRHAPKKSIDGKFVGRRAKKPKLLAVVTGACTGCSGAPVCQIYCPVEDCMLLVPAEDAFPFGLIWVDPLKCVGCQKCISRGPEETYLDGCPWDAIVMVSTSEWEKQHGPLAF